MNHCHLHAGLRLLYNVQTILLGEPNGLVVEPRTPEGEVGFETYLCHVFFE